MYFYPRELLVANWYHCETVFRKQKQGRKWRQKTAFRADTKSIYARTDLPVYLNIIIFGILDNRWSLLSQKVFFTKKFKPKKL